MAMAVSLLTTGIGQVSLSITMTDSLSAFLIIISLLYLSFLSAVFSALLRLGHVLSWMEGGVKLFHVYNSQ